MITTKIKTHMQKNIYLYKYVDTFRKSKFIYWIHWIDETKKKKSKQSEMDAFSKFYSENYKCFDEVLGLLADEESKNTYKAVIDFRKNRNFKALAKYVSYPQYFVKDIFDNCNDEIFVDGGAYIGDTILALSQYMGGMLRRYMHGNVMK